MEYLVYAAAAIPFLVVLVGVTVLGTVRYSLKDTHLRVTVMGIPVRKVAYADVISCEFFPPDEETNRRSLFKGSGVIVMRLHDGHTVAISPRYAEGFYEALRGKMDKKAL
ncbi:MAG: hypothetical protein HZA22_04775 [Nitrospirae bacterium]|nr:hypothetical protein [Nitrospirota bacterium]